MNLIQSLRQWGADVDTAIDRFVGDEDFYRDCLAMLPEDESYDLLKASLADKEYQAAFEHAHGLKGVVGNLGLTPLYERVCTITEALRSGSYEGTEEMMEQVTEQMDCFMQILARDSGEGETGGQ